MIFFIYAVIGMQVRSYTLQKHKKKSPLKFKLLKLSFFSFFSSFFFFSLSDLWKDRNAGLHSDQQEQQLPDFSSGCSPPLSVSSSSSFQTLTNSHYHALLDSPYKSCQQIKEHVQWRCLGSLSFSSSDGCVESVIGLLLQVCDR